MTFCVPTPSCQEFNSAEAIKGAVQHGLGAAFISTAAIAKELELRLLARVVCARPPCALLTLVFCPGGIGVVRTPKT